MMLLIVKYLLRKLDLHFKVRKSLIDLPISLSTLFITLHISFDACSYPVADDILDATATSEELGKTAGKDENTNKTTYVKLLGLEKSKVEAQKLVDEAKQALAKYGDRAIPLQNIADFIVARKN